jgi:subtilase family serine protease
MTRRASFLLLLLLSFSSSVFAAADLTMTEFIRSPVYNANGTATQPAVTPGGTVKVTGTMQNIGNAAAVASKVRFYLSTDPIYSATDTEIGFVNGNALAANASQFIIEKSLTIPTTTAAGTYFVLCRVDADSQVTENSETNNLFNFTLSIVILPDFIIQSPVAPASIVKGSTGTLSCVIKNNAAATAAASTIQFYLSTNQTYETTDVSLGSSSVSALAGNATSTKSRSITIPATTTPGTYYILYRADSQIQVAEQSETNNVGSKIITIQ